MKKIIIVILSLDYQLQELIFQYIMKRSKVIKIC